MQNLNIYLAETLSEGTFVTMIAAMLDATAGTMEVINAGHPAGLVISPQGDLALTQQEANLPLGLDPVGELAAEKSALAAGSYLTFFTDGLSELPLEDGKLLGEDALAGHLAQLVKDAPAPPSSDALAGALTKLLDGLQCGMSRDDRTFLIARRV